MYLSVRALGSVLSTANQKPNKQNFKGVGMPCSGRAQGGLHSTHSMGKPLSLASEVSEFGSLDSEH